MLKDGKDSKWIGPMLAAIPCCYLGSAAAFYGLTRAERPLSLLLFGGLELFLLSSAILMSLKLRGCKLEDPGCGPGIL